MLNVFEFNNRCYHLVPVLTEYSTWPANYVSRDHYHPVYHIVFIEKGTCFIENNRGKQRVSEGDIILINPNDRHIFSCNRQCTENYVFNFMLVPAISRELVSNMQIREYESTAETAQLEKLTGVESDGWRIVYDTVYKVEIAECLARFNQEILPYLNEIEEDIQKENRMVFNHRSSLFFNELLSFFIPRLYRFRSVWDSDCDSELVRKITGYVRKNITEKYQLKQLAHDIGYSGPYVCNYFRSVTGMSISRYTNRLKIRRACQLLRRTTRSITDVALGLSFSSSQHFAKNFLAETGMSPREYRKRARIQ